MITVSNLLDTNTTNYVLAPRKPLAGVAASGVFNTALEAVEDALADQLQYSSALPGTPEDALLNEADSRYAAARSDLFAVVNSLLASAATR